MSELDTITLFNPTSKDFTHNYNGEPYTIGSRDQKSFSKFVGFHLAKHLAVQMTVDEMSAKEKKDKPLMVGQRVSYDNHWLRINLYKILRDKNIVQDVIAAYPFKGFIGNMEEYETYVKKEEKAPTNKSLPTSEEKSETKQEITS